MNIELEFCDICNESVPAPDLAAGRAHRRGDRLVCASCEQSMGHHDPGAGLGSSSPGAVGLGSSMALDSADLAGAAAGSGGTQTRLAQTESDVPVGTSRFGGGTWLALTALVLAVVLNMSLSGRLELLETETGESLKSVQRDLRNARQDRDAALARVEQTLGVNIAGLGSLMQSQRELDQAALLKLREQISVLRERAATITATFDGFSAQLTQVGAEQGAQQAREGEATAALGERLRAQEDLLIAVQGTLRALSLAPTALAGTGANGEPIGAPPSWTGALGDLSSENPGLRLDAVYTLGSSQDAMVVPHLIPMIQDDDVFVRMAACRTLSDLDARVAVPDLIQALSDGDTVVREAAVVALRRITKRGMRFDPLGSSADRAQRIAKWNDWWNKEGQEFLDQP